MGTSKQFRKPRFANHVKRLAPVIFAGVFLITLTLQGAIAYGQGPTNFVIGVPGRSGCLVCHGDPKMIDSKSKRSLYISEGKLAGSAHREVPCTMCHSDFNPLTGSQSHQGKTGDSRKIAGLSCKNCHEHSEQLKVYDRSVHGRLALGGDLKSATCADCHGSHDIKSLKKTSPYRKSFRMAADKVCGKCHAKYFESYDDYYHGRAYKMAAEDAPTCWDCHGSHNILPAKNAESAVSSVKLAKTCGKCHVDARSGFAKFGKMIHGRQDIMKQNIVIKYKDMLVDWFNATVLAREDASPSPKREVKPAAATPKK